jgi:hypothetical protein
LSYPCPFSLIINDSLRAAMFSQSTVDYCRRCLPLYIHILIGGDAMSPPLLALDKQLYTTLATTLAQ